MSFTQFTAPAAVTGNISLLDDRPTLSAAALKQAFDKAGNELLEDLQGLVTDLNALLGELENSASAASLGAAAVCAADTAAANIQAKLGFLKTYIDDKVIAAGAGDMQKSTYDTDEDGVVDNAEKLGGQLPAYYAAADHTHALSSLGAAAALAVVTDTASTAKTLATIADNTEYRLGTLTALTVSALPTGYYIASIKFTAGASITVSMPASLKWLGGTAPTFAANKGYEISIADGCACVGEF